MTTIIIGTEYFSDDKYTGNKRKENRCRETIEGDAQRTGSSDTTRTIFLDSRRASIQVYNTDGKGVFVTPQGPQKDRVTFTKNGDKWTPRRGEPVKDGFPIVAEVENLGRVEITWKPRG